jgi:hypothetical protein
VEYYETLKTLHKTLRPNVYLEVGIRAGESLRLASGRTKVIGIDPDYSLLYPYLKSSMLIKETSDIYFESKINQAYLRENPIDFAFIDGMHLFEFALRDFINIERHAAKNAVVAIHDCLVKDAKTSSRKRTTDFWTGDVWKVIAILKKYRKDLKIIPLDPKPSGLTLITNLDPQSTFLSKNYKKIEKEFIDVEFNNRYRLESIDHKTFDYSLLVSKKWSLLKKGKRLLQRSILRKPKALGVLLCYNDADILEDAIKHLRSNHHDIIVWDHGSTDTTSKILNKYIDTFIEYKYVPREFDFYKLYEAMSKNLIDNYIDQYDWISWPDQDEILEGPDRKKTYFDYVTEVFRSPYNWIQFNNFNFWFTEEDDLHVESPVKRIKRYCLFPETSPRIRSWRASVTNIRRFNHNKLKGERYPKLFILKHYPMRSLEQMNKRLDVDRANLQRGEANFHYNTMKNKRESLFIKSNKLHYDDGSDLNFEIIYDWNNIYRNI